MEQIIYKQVYPEASLAYYVDSFWMLESNPDAGTEVVVLPDGRIDLFFSLSATEPFHVTLLGLGTRPEAAMIEAGTRTFAVSFNLPAAAYLFPDVLIQMKDGVKLLPDDLWEYDAGCLEDFDAFCKRTTARLQSLLPEETDSRKRQLFELLYAAHGGLTVRELSERAFWSARQINRYFKQQFGLTLKAYSNILRFRAAFSHIHEGKLFPEGDFTDQPHFIKEVRKFSGVSPKELYRNHNGRFIQFSTLEP